MISKTKVDILEDDLFWNFLKYRKDQACRSTVIKVGSNVMKKKHCKSDFIKLQNLCSVYGSRFTMFQYNINERHFALVEFENIEEIRNLVFGSNKESMEEFTNIEGREFMLFQKEKCDISQTEDEECKKGNVLNASITNSSNVNELLKSLKSYSTDKQLLALYNKLKLNELQIRLRFLTWRQLQNIIKGLIPEAVVYPFGSSVTGLGLNGCDLDLVIVNQNNGGPIIHEDSNIDCEEDRQVLQNHLTALHQVLNSFGRGISVQNFIKHARVPIIKYKNEFTGVECDLSLYRHASVKMTQMLYTCLNMDERVKPLVNFIRIWAKSLNLVAPKQYPNQYPSNFCITLLAIFFLQQSSSVHPAILPSFNYFPATNKSLFLRNEDVATSVEKFRSSNAKLNNKTLRDLLILYFKFYSNFDFANFGCCLYTGQIIEKINKFKLCPMYIKNPYEQHLNVSQNVSVKAVKNFQYCANRAFNILSTTSSKENEQLIQLCNINFYNESDSKTINLKNILF